MQVVPTERTSARVTASNLQIAPELYALIEDRILPGNGISSERFWASLDSIISEFSPRVRQLLQKRTELQTKIDSWHRSHAGASFDRAAYKKFLSDIGYLQPEGPDFEVTTSNVDPEISQIAGPQLVVPVMNARYALNAANARWGSLYDALYGTDVIPESDGAEKGTSYNRVRGDKVIAYARTFLDEAAPLASGSWTGATGLSVEDSQLQVASADGSVGLASPEKFIGYTGELGSPAWSVLLVNHGLHIEILIDPESPIGK